MKARITGKVLLVENKKFGSGEREFRFKLAHVQTGVASIEELRFTENYEHDYPRVGDLLDVEVEVSGYSGRNGLSLSLTAVQPFDESYALSVAA